MIDGEPAGEKPPEGRFVGAADAVFDAVVDAAAGPRPPQGSDLRVGDEGGLTPAVTLP